MTGALLRGSGKRSRTRGDEGDKVGKKNWGERGWKMFHVAEKKERGGLAGLGCKHRAKGI